MSKFKVGDKVRMVNRHDSDIKYGWVGTVTEDDPNPYVDWGRDGYEEWAVGGEENLELVTNEGDNEVEPKQERRTFKLVKSTFDIKKGAIFQEQCEDGTQPYELITRDEHYLEADVRHGNYTVVVRELIESKPDWFVEVFKVTPEYMTREELDEWEAFKSRKKSSVIHEFSPKNSGPHMSHTKKQGDGFYRHGTAVISKERMDQVLEVVRTSRNTESAAKKLKLTKGTVESYIWLAKKNGVKV